MTTNSMRTDLKSKDIRKKILVINKLKGESIK